MIGSQFLIGFSKHHPNHLGEVQWITQHNSIGCPSNRSAQLLLLPGKVIPQLKHTAIDPLLVDPNKSRLLLGINDVVCQNHILNGVGLPHSWSIVESRDFDDRFEGLECFVEIVLLSQGETGEEGEKSLVALHQGFGEDRENGRD